MIISLVAKKGPALLTLIAPKEGDIFRIIKNPEGYARVFNLHGDFNQRGQKGALIEPPSFKFNLPIGQKINNM